MEHKEFVLSSRFANSKLLLLFLLPPQNTIREEMPNKEENRTSPAAALRDWVVKSIAPNFHHHLPCGQSFLE